MTAARGVHADRPLASYAYGQRFAAREAAWRRLGDMADAAHAAAAAQIAEHPGDHVRVAITAAHAAMALRHFLDAAQPGE